MSITLLQNHKINIYIHFKNFKQELNLMIITAKKEIIRKITFITLTIKHAGN